MPLFSGHALYFFDNFRVGQGGNISDILIVGYRPEYAPHDFTGTGFGHISDDPDLARFCDFADLFTDRIGYALCQTVIPLNAGF
jgi:hypothetical protein